MLTQHTSNGDVGQQAVFALLQKIQHMDLMGRQDPRLANFWKFKCLLKTLHFPELNKILMHLRCR